MIRPSATLSRWHWRNWPVLVKLVAVLLVPTVVALVVGVLRIVDQAGAVPGYVRISEVAGVQQKLADLISAIQQERELAAAFVAAGRSGDPQPLERQFREVTSRSEVVRTAADQVENLESTGYEVVLEQLRALRPLRQSVTAGTSPVDVVITEYGAAIDPLLALDAALVRQLDHVGVADIAAAAHALVASREQVSRQDAIVSAALSVNRIGRPQIEDVRAAEVRLGAEQDAFLAALEPVERAGYVGRIAGDAERSRQRLLELVLNRGSTNLPLDISPDDWSTRSEVIFNDIAAIENELRQRIDRTAVALRDDARATAAWSAAILIFALALGVLIGFLIARSMLRPLGVLKRTALDVAERRLPAAMYRVRQGGVPDQTIEPVAVTTREEIGQVARAFDEVHRQAVRLAGEQAQLRAHVNDIFVNLSRRSQGLVERQLQLIDQLESNEQDPDQLHNLFQLDHLATRMRRNSENLLVLAGTEATKRSSRPVRLVDVLRAAVSEVEQYQRLVLQPPPAVLVLGRAAGDLVHLLAELLDNATQFSPPDSHVVVSAQVGADGSVRVEIVDRGVGMTEPEFAAANERLASTPVVDASVSRRMGLFVVGRLAARHGIGVRLGGGEDGLGVRATVTMPPRLVRSVPETPDSGSSHAPQVLPIGEKTRSEGEGAFAEQAKPLPRRVVQPGVAAASRGRAGDLGGNPFASNGLRTPAQSDAPNQSESPLPRRVGKQPAPGDLPPEAPVPPGRPATPPLARPSAESGHDLFRPGGVQGGIEAPAGPRTRTVRQDPTPIFDDVASAWFQEHDAVPMNWASADSPAQQPETHSPARPSVAHSPARPSVASGDDAVRTGSAVTPSAWDAAQAMPAPSTQRADWGNADEGWQAAQALAQPVTTEVTAAGLPRRQPRALLVPGAPGGEAAEPTGAPARSAESVRGRLSSYQRGIREGRQSSRVDQHADDFYQEQEAEEETK